MIFLDRAFEQIQCMSLICVVGGIKNKELGLWGRRGLLANVSAGVSVTTECLSGGKWLLYTRALWP